MMEVVLEQFLEEARELADEAGRGLVELERTPADKQLVNTVFRAFHTMKGSSALFDFQPLVRSLHAAEDLLHGAREGTDPLTPDKADVLFAVLDQLGTWFSVLATGAPLPHGAEELAEQLVERARAVGGEHIGGGRAPESDELKAVSETPSWLKLAASVPEFVGRALVGIEYDPEPGCFFTGDDPLRLLSLVPDLISLRVLGLDELRADPEGDPYQCRLRFRAVAACGLDGIRALFAYVHDQVRVYEFSVGLGPEIDDCVRLLREVVSSLETPVPSEIAATRRASQALLVRRVLTAAGFPETWLRAFETSSARAQEAGMDAELRTAVERVLGTIAAAGRVGMRMSMLPNKHRMAQLSAPPIQVSLGPRSAASRLVAHMTGAGSQLAPVIIQKSGEQPPEGEREGLPEPDKPADPVARAKEERATAPQVYKVDQTRLDALLDLAGELLVAKNALPYLARRAESAYAAPALAREIKEQSAALHRIADSFHHAVMQLRIIPIATVFERFPRLVRDLSRQLGKQVHLAVEGGATEADKSTVEKLADPLIHLLRNALDHGLETPSQRLEAGKPSEGLIKLTAQQDRGALLVTIEDDGRGIDPMRIRETAVRRGLLSPQEAAQLSDDDAIQLIFRAGFSTKEQVSDLSGRGVGMDVVQTTLRACKGTVRVQSEAGRGTTVRLSLPLSMAVTRALLVEVEGQVFGIPFELVAESVHVARERIARIQGQEAVTIRDRVVPLAHLATLLGLSKTRADHHHHGDGLLTVLLIRLPIGEVALAVDGLRETVDVMLKPLDGPLASLPGYLGASLLGDGRTLLVLSLADLF